MACVIEPWNDCGDDCKLSASSASATATLISCEFYKASATRGTISGTAAVLEARTAAPKTSAA